MSQQADRRPIGRILRDGGLISEAELAAALEEQRLTNELLGPLLVRTGVLAAGEVRAALAVQEQLGDLEQAVRLGAGVRQQLGRLLVQAGRLSEEELDQVLAEQQRGGGRLGEAARRLGLLSGPELKGMLEFQRNQCPDRRHASPLRLGELLVCTGHISRDRLVDALRKQAVSRKKLGDVLVEEGHAQLTQIGHCVRLQQLLMSSALAAILSLSAATMTSSANSPANAGV